MIIKSVSATVGEIKDKYYSNEFIDNVIKASKGGK